MGVSKQVDGVVIWSAQLPTDGAQVRSVLPVEQRRAEPADHPAQASVAADRRRALPVNQVQRIRVVARVLRQPFPELSAWLLGAINSHVYDDADIGKALGLVGPSKARAPRTEWLLSRRNNLLRRALAELDGNYNKLAKEIAAHLRVSAACGGAKPLSGSSYVRVLVQRADEVGIDLPKSEWGLRKTLASRN